MFARKLKVAIVSGLGESKDAPVRWIDSFAMRNFTNDAVFDDTLPVGDGLLEVGYRVPVDRLEAAMNDWFRRKGYLEPGERLSIALLKGTGPEQEMA